MRLQYCRPVNSHSCRAIIGKTQHRLRQITVGISHCCAADVLRLTNNYRRWRILSTCGECFVGASGKPRLRGSGRCHWLTAATGQWFNQSTWLNSIKMHTERRNWTELNWHGLVFDELTKRQAVIHYSGHRLMVYASAKWLMGSSCSHIGQFVKK